MFTDLKLKSVYYSKESNIAAEFYAPVLANAVSFNRVSAFFSAKALSYCAEGMELFISNNGKCRIILSKEISRDDYEYIKKGYKLREKLEKHLIEDLSTEISISEENKLADLAYLIAKGIVDIKIAFMPVSEGIFHYKFGIYYDNNGNAITSYGSDNFTKAAITDNAEALTITCSWLCSDFEAQRISDSKVKFEKLWDNEDNEAIVLSPSEKIMDKLISYNKNNNSFINHCSKHNSIFFTLIDNTLILCDRTTSDSNSKIIKKIYLKRFIDADNAQITIFKNSISYIDMKEIIKICQNKIKNTEVILSSSLLEHISSKELYIQERSQLGLDIKNRNTSLLPKFQQYSDVLNKVMSRELRDRQLWDSFFMYVMKKSSNFSVPGSGKTSSALGVFAYLQALDKVDKIVVISPINAFGSWIDEFNACFGNKLKLNCFNSQSNLSSEEKHNILEYEYGKYNLFLFNYENIHKYKSQIAHIIKNNAILIFDEVHKIKGIEGKRAQTAIEIAKDANYVITMTGTPIPNSYSDIYNNLRVLFPDEYNSWFNFSPQFLKNANKNDILNINTKIRPFFCRTSKNQLGVPVANPDIQINIFPTEAESELFSIVYSKYKNNKFALIVRLLQLESSPKLLLEKIDLSEFQYILDERDEIEDLEYKNYSQDAKELIESIEYSSKTKYCTDNIKKLVSEGKKVIVWTLFTKTIDNLCYLLKLNGLSAQFIRGDIPPDRRIDLINDFKNGKYDILVTNPQTLAESISLHSICHDAIYFEYSYNLVHLLQSKDRIHRLGLPEHQYTQYYFLRNNYNLNGYKYSLDEQIYNRLLLKEQIMLEAVDSNNLERHVSSDEEDINAIFEKLKI